MTEEIKDKVEDLEDKLDEKEMPAALKAYLKKKNGKDDEDEDEDEDDEDEKEMKEKKHAKMKEDIDAIFSGEDLSEDFKKNAQAIFEAAIESRIQEIDEALEAKYAQQLEEQVESITAGIVEKVDEYLDYVVNEWVEENKLAIEKNLKAEVAEDFMVGLKNLFVENYIDIPEDKVDLVDEMATKLEQAEQDLDKKLSENAELVAELNEYKKGKIVTEVTEGLSEIQVEKLKSLAENIEFVSEEDYAEKLSLTKKKYFESSSKDEETVETKKDALNEETSTLEESYTPSMEKYVKNLSRFVKK
jgi:hypothetical protein